MSNNWRIKDNTKDRWIDVDSRKAGEDKLEEFEGELELELKAPDGRTVETNFEQADNDDVDPEVVDHSPDGDPGTPAAKAADPTTDGGPQTRTGAEVVGDGEDVPVPNETPEEALKASETTIVETDPEPTETAVGTTNDVQQGHIDLEDPESHLPGWMLTEITHGNGDSGIDLNKNGTQVVSGALGLEVNAECEVSAKETDFEYARYRATVVKPDGRTYNAVGDCHIDEQGKSKWDLERQAETRAKKRCVKWASSGGIEALEAVRK